MDKVEMLYNYIVFLADMKSFYISQKYFYISIFPNMSLLYYYFVIT